MPAPKKKVPTKAKTKSAFFVLDIVNDCMWGEKGGNTPFTTQKQAEDFLSRADGLMDQQCLVPGDLDGDRFHIVKVVREVEVVVNNAFDLKDV